AARLRDDLDDRRPRPRRLRDRPAHPPALRPRVRRLPGDHRRARRLVLPHAAPVLPAVGSGVGPLGTQAGPDRLPRRDRHREPPHGPGRLARPAVRSPAARRGERGQRVGGPGGGDRRRTSPGAGEAARSAGGCLRGRLRRRTGPRRPGLAGRRATVAVPVGGGDRSGQRAGGDQAVAGDEPGGAGSVGCRCRSRSHPHRCDRSRDRRPGRARRGGPRRRAGPGTVGPGAHRCWARVGPGGRSAALRGRGVQLARRLLRVRGDLLAARGRPLRPDRRADRGALRRHRRGPRRGAGRSDPPGRQPPRRDRDAPGRARPQRGGARPALAGFVLAPAAARPAAARHRSGLRHPDAVIDRRRSCPGRPAGHCARVPAVGRGARPGGGAGARRVALPARLAGGPVPRRRGPDRRSRPPDPARAGGRTGRRATGACGDRRRKV
ncbi:MAG: Uncharacterized MFS-type transporter, partial [uncultured Acidimicrobiales bacterium]